jgi:hypothetical protein
MIVILQDERSMALTHVLSRVRPWPSLIIIASTCGGSLRGLPRNDTGKKFIDWSFHAFLLVGKNAKDLFRIRGCVVAHIRQRSGRLKQKSKTLSLESNCAEKHGFFPGLDSSAEARELPLAAGI